VPEIVTQADDLINRVIMIRNEDTTAMARQLTKEEGLFVAFPQAQTCFAAIEPRRKSGKGKMVMTVLPSNAHRYFSTDLFKTSTTCPPSQDSLQRVPISGSTLK
jgi:cysteine synthase